MSVDGHTHTKQTHTHTMMSTPPVPTAAAANDDRPDDGAAVLSPWRQEWPWNGAIIPPLPTDSLLPTAPRISWSFYDAEEEEDDELPPAADSSTDAFAPLDAAAPPALFTAASAATLPLPSSSPPPPAAAFDFVGLGPASQYSKVVEEDLTECANAYIARFHPNASSSAEAVAALVPIVPCILSKKAQITLGQQGMDGGIASLTILTSDGAIKWYWVGDKSPLTIVPPFCISADAMRTRPVAYMRNVLDSIQSVERHAAEGTLSQIIGRIPMRRREF